MQQVRLSIKSTGQYQDRAEVGPFLRLVERIRSHGRNLTHHTSNTALLEEMISSFRPQTFAVAVHNDGTQLFFLTEDGWLAKNLEGLAKEAFGAGNVSKNEDLVYEVLWGHVLKQASAAKQTPMGVYFTYRSLAQVFSKLEDGQLEEIVELLSETYHKPTAAGLKSGDVHNVLVTNANIVVGKTADYISEAVGFTADKVEAAAKAYDALISAAAVYLAPGPFMHSVRRLVEYSCQMGASLQQQMDKTLVIPRSELAAIALSLGQAILEKHPGLEKRASIFADDIAYLTKYVSQQPARPPAQTP